MNQIIKKGFTLIELVIVIGIIAIIATILLLSFNPAETQRRARDNARLKDVTTLQTIAEQALNDGVTFCTGICESSSVAGNVQPCTASWLRDTGSTGSFVPAICNYAKTVPADPLSRPSATCTRDDGTTAGNCQMYYWLRTSGLDYEINVRMESANNKTRVGNDAGDHIWVYEIFNNTNDLIPGNGGTTGDPNVGL